MKRQLRYLLMVLTLLSVSKSLIAQTSTITDANLSPADTSNIALRFTISEPVFDSLVNKFVNIMQEGDAIKSLTDNIILFRLYNTLDWGPETPDKDIYSRLKKLYSHYSTATSHKLEGVMEIRSSGFYYFRISPSRIGVGQKGYYHVLFTKFREVDTSSLARKFTITALNFDSLVNNFVNIMQKKGTIKTVNDYIILVRLYNTMVWDVVFQKRNPAYFNKPMYDSLFDLFHTQYEEYAVKKLHARPRKGLEGYYSDKYDVGIDISPHDTVQKYVYHIIFK